MSGQGARGKLKAALTGALVCGLLGPAVGAVAIFTHEVVRERAIREVVDAFGALLFALLVAVMAVGPGGFVLGGAGALVIQFMSARVRSMRLLRLETAALGLLLGAAVPLTGMLWGARFKQVIGLMPLGAGAGLTCAAVVFWLFRRMGLLQPQQSPS